MQKHAVEWTVICIFFCLSYNCTLPLHRKTMKLTHNALPNRGPQCEVFRIGNRTKNMASNIEIALRKIKDSTQDFGKNFYEHLNSGLKRSTNRSIKSEEDLHAYELSVIMRKYPYLDLKELQQKYSPLLGKHVRQSVNVRPEISVGHEASLRGEQPAEEILNVEINNRGLSGFAIPSQLTKHVTIFEMVSKEKPDDVLDILNLPRVANKSGDDDFILHSLESDVNNYVKKKG